MQCGSYFIPRMRHTHRSRHPHFSFTRGAALRPLALLVPLVAGLAFAGGWAAPPLPKGGQFVAGSGSIGGSGQVLVIDQTSSRGVIDWNSFSIGGGRQVTFNTITARVRRSIA